MRNLLAYLIFTRHVIPWIGRMVAAVFWFTITTLLIFWGSVPQKARSLAFEWQGRAIMRGFPQEWDRDLFNVFLVVAWLSIVAGWVALSWATLTILGWIL